MSKNIKSKLEMLDLFFSDFSMKYNKKSGKRNINTSFKVNYAEKKDDNECLELNLTTIAFFKLNREGINEETATGILRKNTVAIMFPFIRSQISLLTTQPGMTPIMLQPLDVNALVDGEEETEN